MHPQKAWVEVLRESVVAETSNRAIRASRGSRRSCIDTYGDNGSSVFNRCVNIIRGFGKDSDEGGNCSNRLQRIGNNEDNNGDETGALSDKNQSKDIDVTRRSKVSSIHSEEIVFSRASHTSNDKDKHTRPPLFPENGSLVEQTTSEEERVEETSQ
jgi:hypothetical protein